MRIGFVCNDVSTEQEGFTTVRLAQEAVNQGHEMYYMGVGDFAYDPDESISARAYTVPKTKYKSNAAFFADLSSKKAVRERITVSDLDVLMLRNVPSDDFIHRPWATSPGIEFGRLAMRKGVMVVNDPNGLAKAGSKMYFQLYPEQVRPRTLITRDNAEIRAFAKEEGVTWHAN